MGIFKIAYGRVFFSSCIMQTLPEDRVVDKYLSHKLTMWYVGQLPKDHSLLK